MIPVEDAYMHTGLGAVLVYAMIGWVIRMLVYPPLTFKHAARAWGVGCLLAILMSNPLAYYLEGLTDIPRYDLRPTVAGLLGMAGADLIRAAGKFLKSKMNIEAKDKHDDTFL